MTEQEIMQLAQEMTAQGQVPELEIIKRGDLFLLEGDNQSWRACYDFCVKNYANCNIAYELGKYCIQSGESDNAINYLIFSASKNNYDALVMLGELYRDGSIVSKDYDTATEYFLRAVELTNDKEQKCIIFLTLADIYRENSVTEETMYQQMIRNAQVSEREKTCWKEKIRILSDEAIKYYKKAVEMDEKNLYAKYELANSLLLFMYTSEYDSRGKGFKIAKKLADEDNFLIAVDLVCDCYMRGSGVQKNLTIAEQYFEKLKKLVEEEEKNPQTAFNIVKVKESIKETKNQLEEAKNKKSGCYVATCVYGSYDCPEVWTLRRFRDNILSKNYFGRLFIKCYYAVSPTAVKMFGHCNWFQMFFKMPLDGLVKKLTNNGVENTPYYDK